MARPRSEDKQMALLEAATDVVAAQGLGAPTSLIAKRAGVAEGTLFRYFPTKDDLLNELYVHIKRHLGEAMRSPSHQGDSLSDIARALWDGYIDWGLANPQATKALKQLAVSDRITVATRTRVAEFFPEVHRLSLACIDKGPMVNLPAAFANTILLALADTTMHFVATDPERGDAYKAAGFKVFWDGLAR